MIKVNYLFFFLWIKRVPNVFLVIGWVFFCKKSPQAEFQSNHVFLWCHMQFGVLRSVTKNITGGYWIATVWDMTCPANFSSFYTVVMVGPGPLRSVFYCGRVMETTLNKWSVILLLSLGVWFVSSCSSLWPKRQIFTFLPFAGNAHSKWRFDKAEQVDMAKWTEQTFGQVKGASIAKQTENKGTKPAVDRAKKPWQGIWECRTEAGKHETCGLFRNMEIN